MWEVASSVITQPPVVISSRPSLTNLFTTIFFVGWALKMQRSTNGRGAKLTQMQELVGWASARINRASAPLRSIPARFGSTGGFIHFRARDVPSRPFFLYLFFYLFIFTHRTIQVANHIYRWRISTGLDLRDLCVRVLCTTYIAFPIRRWFPHYAVYVGHKAATDSTCYTSLILSLSIYISFLALSLSVSLALSLLSLVTSRLV